MFAVCAKKETKIRYAGNAEIRDQMFQQKFGAKAKRYLADLRRQAMIEYKMLRTYQIGGQKRDIVQPLALTLGEPAGIGPDLALAIWRRRAELDLPPFYIVADPDFLRPARRSAWSRRSDRQRDADVGRGDVSFGAAGRCLSTSRSAPSRAARIDRAHRPRSLRFAARSPTSWRARRRRSSPIRSPRTCSTIGALPSPATPNSWRRWCRRRPASRCGR